MTAQDRELVALRDLCYGGQWQAMRIDLERRTHERPYIHALQQRIAEDLVRIEELSKASSASGHRTP